jgi:hypothetical protein
MTSFANWVKFDLRKSASFDRYDEVDELMREKLAGDIQTQLRSRLDPGINKKGVAAAPVKVVAEGNRFVIQSDDADDVLGASSRMTEEATAPGLDAGSIEDLFEPSSGIPISQRNPDGSTSLVYRRIELSRIFQEQQQKAQEAAASQAIETAVTNNMGSRLEEAFDEVDRKHPGDE